MVDNVKEEGRVCQDTDAAEGQKERENASHLPMEDGQNIDVADLGFDGIPDFDGNNNIVTNLQYGTTVTPTKSNLEVLCLEVNKFPPPATEPKDERCQPPVTHVIAGKPYQCFDVDAKVFVDPTPKSPLNT